MEWTLKMEHKDSQGIVISTTVAKVDRPELQDEADLGLTLDLGKRLLHQIQSAVVADQARGLIAKARQCSRCGRTRSIKDHRCRRIDTVYGQVRIHTPRLAVCTCGSRSVASPVASLFPYRATPELRHLQVKLGSEFSYRQAADLLREFLPEPDGFNHATIRNRVLAVGRQVEAETKAEISERAAVGKTADHMVVGIDGAFVAATRSRTQRRHFEVVLGRIEAPAAVRDLDEFARERVRSALRRAGRGPATRLTILSDGEDAMPRMAGEWLDDNLDHRLDWFHLNRRIKWLWNAVYHTLGLGDLDAETRFRRYGRALKSIRWNLWHYGRSWHARWMIPISRLAALILSHRLETEAAGQSTSRIDELYRKFQEFQGYVYRNIGSLADYATHWRKGERVSTAHVESTVNQLINQRMCKKRQMRWSRLGAQLMLNVRTAQINRRLERYTGMPGPTSLQQPSNQNRNRIAA